MKNVNLLGIKHRIATFNSLDDLKELSDYLDNRHRHLEQKSADAKNREAWDCLNQPVLKPGDVVCMSKQSIQWERGGFVRLEAGMELTVVAVQSRAKRIWVKTPPGWNFSPEIYFDGRDLRLLRRPETSRLEAPQQGEREPLSVGNLQ